MVEEQYHDENRGTETGYLRRIVLYSGLGLGLLVGVGSMEGCVPMRGHHVRPRFYRPPVRIFNPPRFHKQSSHHHSRPSGHHSRHHSRRR